MNKREWLVERGLATPGRGRFSAEAKSALTEAVAAGVVFDEPVIAQPKAPRVSREVVLVPDRDTYSARDVREWAESQGIAVGARGRIDKVVVINYLESQTQDRIKQAIHAERVDDPSIILELQARTFPEDARWVPVADTDNRRAIGGSNVCMPCGVSLGWHKCIAPMALVKGERDYVLVRLVN